MHSCRKFSILLFDRFSNHCLANLVEPLRAANDHAGRMLYDWEYLSLSGNPVTSSAGMPILPDRSLNSSEGGDILFVHPSYDHLRHANQSTSRTLRAADSKFNTLAGLDTGSWLLAEAGLLEDQPATIHWDVLEEFSEAFPNIHTTEEPYVIGDDRITCGGAMTTFDLICELIGQDHGEALRLHVSGLFQHGPRSARARPGGLAERAVQVMRANLEEVLVIPALAKKLGTNRQNLENAFQSRMGTTPSAVYRNLRLTQARQLLESGGFSVAEVAARVGYQNASAMSRAFLAEFGVSPSAIRQGGKVRFWAKGAADLRDPK